MQLLTVDEGGVRWGTYTIRFFRVVHKMIDRKLGFNDNQSPFPKDEWRIPRRNKLRILVKNRLLGQSSAFKIEASKSPILSGS